MYIFIDLFYFVVLSVILFPFVVVNFIYKPVIYDDKLTMLLK